MFADDTCGLDADENLGNLTHRINAEINKIAVWFKANKMATNVTDNGMKMCMDPRENGAILDAVGGEGPGPPGGGGSEQLIPDSGGG
jgi:hypothetical protein